MADRHLPSASQAPAPPPRRRATSDVPTCSDRPAGPVAAIGPAGPLRVEQVLHLQRTLGNHAVQGILARHRPPAPSAAAPPGVQRMIAVKEPHDLVYHPADLDTSGEFAATFRGMMGDAVGRRAVTWAAFRHDVAWPDAEWTSGERDATSEEVEDETRQRVLGQFEDEDVIHAYSRADMVQWGYPDMEPPVLLLDPDDMREAGQVPGQQITESETCVIQALDSFGVNVPGLGVHTVAAWHNYFRTRAPGLDYRTDSHYVRVYVGILGYTLVNNAVIAWDAIPWEELGDGNYLVGTYPNGQPQGGETGHMIGAVVAGGAVTAVHDQQGLTEPYLDGHNVYARYIFRM
ncbi:MAG: hypothetical protein JWM27_728 [Gemmatimonadetes bacterium]|nr:hypothetical protein [Gemmatimonadota bacterium]